MVKPCAGSALLDLAWPAGGALSGVRLHKEQSPCSRDTFEHVLALVVEDTVRPRQKVSDVRDRRRRKCVRDT